MPVDLEHATERSHLLSYAHGASDRRLNTVQHDGDAISIVSSHVSKEEQALFGTPVGERLPYNDYTTIDWLHELVGCPINYVIRHADLATDQRFVQVARST